MIFKGVIFDLDGVLVDTVPVHFLAWKQMFGEYGYELDHDKYRAMVDGRPRFDGARAVMVRHDDDDVRKAASRKNDLVIEMLGREEFTVFQSALDFISECLEKNLPIATASSSENVRFVLEKAGILDRFTTIVAGNEVPRGKPNPDIFLAAAQKMGIDPSEAVVIEDSKFGVQAAKSGGFFCVGINQHGAAADLEGADIIISDLGQLSVDSLRSLMNSPSCSAHK